MNKKSLKYLFVVQGEGRGHMTQALSLAVILRAAGHEVCHVVAGKSKRRELPGFFSEKIEAPITLVDSPNFITDKDQKSVKPLKTVIHSVLNAAIYRRSIRTIHRLVKTHQPDAIINFYDFIGGLYNFSMRPKCRFICLAHQYLTAHPSFEFPPNRTFEKIAMQMANRITSLGADKILALSFRTFEDVPEKKLFVVPPLLRKELKTQKITLEDHFLVYMVNPGYSTEVNVFHQEFPDQPLHCFWDKKDAPEELTVDNTLTFHQLDDTKFIQKMASCTGYVTTAGFESVCEAMYLGKPVLMVPVGGHYEQACNAVDAVNAGAGISSSAFDIDLLVHYLPKYENTSKWFREWADQAPVCYLQLIGA